MNTFVIKDGKSLRCGYTTGSCAAAAAKAAAWMLLAGKKRELIHLLTPKGIELDLQVLDPSITYYSASCAIRKDSGDDPDVTNGMLIYASVTRKTAPGIDIEGGIGIGHVTKPGLDQPIGNAAINSIPRQMIRENIEEVAGLFDYSGGFHVTISAPEGEERAKRTFNSRMGIIGGISIIGTTGIVEPMSDHALIETIRLELKQRCINGSKYVLLTPGNYGMNFLQKQYGINPDVPVMTSNFIGDALVICSEMKFEGILLAGHVGKLVKLAGGILNTHSRYGDCRMEILTAHAAVCGIAPQKAAEMMQCVTCDEAIRIMQDENICYEVFRGISDHILFNLSRKTSSNIQIGVIMFSNIYGILHESGQVSSLISRFTEGAAI